MNSFKTRMIRTSKRFLTASSRLYYSEIESRQKFIDDYRIRSTLERFIHNYAQKDLPQFSIDHLYNQSTNLDKDLIVQNARETVDQLLIFNARRLLLFRSLPYLAVLNPSISESYNLYLDSMSLLIASSFKIPTNTSENVNFTQETLSKFIDIHTDALPGLSKGFGEVLPFVGIETTRNFLDSHLVERIRMRLIAHQHVELTNTLEGSTDAISKYEKGSRYNGVIKLLDLPSVIKKNADMVNDLFLIKYDKSVTIDIDSKTEGNFWLKNDINESERKPESTSFPYIEFHLDYILTEAFKNSFRAHIENNVEDPVQITISVSNKEPGSYMELRIRDKGKGIPKKVLSHIFDYSYTTYDSGEGDSYKTLNVPPGVEGNIVAGMGYGLPLLKNYVEAFNETQSDLKPKGLLSLQTYPDWGTDLYIKAVGL